MTTTPRGRRPVTIVVPIYDDLPGLERCIEALLGAVDFTADRVLLANDVGPNADAIERRVHELVGDHPGFEYARNERNLGFVGNCNRAALELDRTGNDVLFLNSDTVPLPQFVDEMAEVLASDPTFGVVCARSDNATIASMPYARRNPRANTSPRRTRELHGRIRGMLPRVSVVPVAMGFCFLVRRELVDRFGLFDEAFAPGYGEENDFCLRVNEHGFKSVFANRALVLHVGSTSFSGDRGPTLRLEHERILLERYPYYAGAVALFLSRYRDPVDVFADTFLPDDGVRRVAVHVPEKLDDATIARLRQLADAAPEDTVMTFVGSRTLARELRQLLPGANVLAGGRTRQVFDVAVALGALTEFRQLSALNANAPRWLLVDTVPHQDRWSQAVLHHRATAIDRIVRRFEDGNAVWTGAADLHADVAEIAQLPIDAERLRRRWDAVTDIAEATGFLAHSPTVPLRRLTALALGARSPRLVRGLRALLARRA